MLDVLTTCVLTELGYLRELTEIVVVTLVVASVVNAVIIAVVNQEAVAHYWGRSPVVANRLGATLDAFEDAQAAQCVALQARPDLLRSTTLFHWWPQRIQKRQVPRRL